MDPELRKELRGMLKDTAQKPLQAARANASWSRRIPGAITLQISFSKKAGGVALRASQKKAPNARVYENQGKPGAFRHPVFGHNVWVSENARPFLWRAAEPWFEETDENIGRVIDSVAHRFDFH